MSQRKVTPPADRFWPKVEKTETCWNWIGAKVSAGYGSFAIRSGKSVAAHRLSYELVNGPIQEGMHLDHVCHNKACVNPDHLRAVTHKQNTENLLGAKNNSKSGVRGVWWNDDCQKWAAKVGHNYKAHYLGLFETLADAEAAVIAKRIELHTHNDLDRRAS